MGAAIDELHGAVREILVEVAQRGDTITYRGMLVDLARRDPALGDAAAADLAPVLRAVSIAEDDAGSGLLTAVVVRSDGGLPGGGFFRLAERRGRDVADRRAAWSAELARVHEAHSPRS